MLHLPGPVCLSQSSFRGGRQGLPSRPIQPTPTRGGGLQTPFVSCFFFAFLAAYLALFIDLCRASPFWRLNQFRLLLLSVALASTPGWTRGVGGGVPEYTKVTGQRAKREAREAREARATPRPLTTHPSRMCNSAEFLH